MRARRIKRNRKVRLKEQYLTMRFYPRSSR